MFVKICANTNMEDARTAAELGANAVGFVFARSKRRVTPEQVETICEQLPGGVERVGVFATDDPYEVEHAVMNCGLTGAQLHLEYDAEMVRLLAAECPELKIVQTVAYPVDARDRVAADAVFSATLQTVFADARVWAVLLDARRAGVSGGLGVAFDWAHVAAIVERARQGRVRRVILAGGLTPENVGEAMGVMRPWGVDVASGVERAPGTKDWEKMRLFVAKARAAGAKR